MGYLWLGDLQSENFANRISLLPSSSAWPFGKCYKWPYAWDKRGVDWGKAPSEIHGQKPGSGGTGDKLKRTAFVKRYLSPAKKSTNNYRLRTVGWVVQNVLWPKPSVASTPTSTRPINNGHGRSGAITVAPPVFILRSSREVCVINFMSVQCGEWFTDSDTVISPCSLGSGRATTGLWRAIAAKNHQHLINQRNLQSTNESCNQLMRY